MDSDDAPVGRILSRREALAVLSATGAAMLAACAAPRFASTVQPATSSASSTIAPTSVPAAPAATAASKMAPAAPSGVAVQPACVVSPEMTEGPYFVDEKLNRADIRANTVDSSIKEGVPLKLTVRVGKVSGTGCTPLAGAQVDIWHCDAVGVYSDATDRSFNTKGQNFLRGYQVTDANGAVVFDTIVPGWYPGRAVHIHFKVRNGATLTQNFEFTSQFFFNEADLSTVYTLAPYATKGTGYMHNSEDNIYSGGGDQTTLTLIKNGSGYTAAFDLGMQLT